MMMLIRIRQALLCMINNDDNNNDAKYVINNSYNIKQIILTT